MSEIWKPIPGYPGYEASDQGRILSHKVFGKTGGIDASVRRIMKPAVRHRGRLYVTLSAPDRSKLQTTIHRLVLLAFVGPCPDGMVGCHNDGNHLHNDLGNLRWDTRKANWADRRKHGVASIGEKHGRSKVTAAQVFEMRQLYAQGHNPVDLGRKYGIDNAQVSRIVTGKNWAHIGGPITHVGKGSKRHLIRYGHGLTPDQRSRSA